MQFNPGLSETEAGGRAKHMYQQTKGSRAYTLNTRGAWLFDNFSGKGKYNGEQLSSGEVGELASVMTQVQQLVGVSPHRQASMSSTDLHTLTDLGVELLVSLGISPTEQVDTELLVNMVRRWRGGRQRISSDLETRESLVERVIWSGGSESATFNRLEEIAVSSFPVTPVLKANITR